MQVEQGKISWTTTIGEAFPELKSEMHNGSNTMFYVVVWMAPEKNCAVIVASNIGVDEAFEGCDEAAGKLIKQFFPK
jgi:hypothetical protein